MRREFICPQYRVFGGSPLALSFGTLSEKYKPPLKWSETLLEQLSKCPEA